jgi:quercetin dioxygenase-like cupin family protein
MVAKKAIENLVAQTVKLVDLVSYQEGSVVSRTIIDGEAGTVTLFAFDAGQGLSEHTTSYDAIVYLVDGEAEIVVSGDVYHVREGEMIIMPANKPHALRGVKKFKMLLIMIRA